MKEIIHGGTPEWGSLLGDVRVSGLGSENGKIGWGEGGRRYWKSCTGMYIASGGG